MSKQVHTVSATSSSRRAVLVMAATLVAGSVGLNSRASAQFVWAGASNGEWNLNTNWNPAGVPNGVDVGVAINATHVVNLAGSPFTFGNLSTSLTTGTVTIGSATTTTDQLTAQVTTGSPTISTAGAAVFFYANLLGTQGITKAGSGRLTFRFNGADQTYAGPVNITGGVFGIERDGSLGDAGNDVTIGNGARLLAEPGTNSGTITLPATRTITLSGLQSQLGAGAATVNLTVLGDVLESTPGSGLVITDLGRVTLAGNVGYTGETRLASGTLALTGPARLPAAQNLRFTGTANAVLELGGANHTVRTIVTDNTSGSPLRRITGGGLTVNGATNLALAGRNAQTFDFAGLDAFAFDRAAQQFKFETINADTVTTIADLNLAKAGASGGANTFTASLVQVGGGTSVGNNGNTARLHLGTQNVVRAAAFQVGGFNAGGVVDFQAGLTDPSLTLRGVDGVGAMATWRISESSSGTRRGEGVVNLTGGTLDALVGDLTIGRHIANAASYADTSSLTMPGGALTANSITLAQKVASGSPILTATLTQGGGTVRAATVIFGTDAGLGTARLLPTYQLNGGTLFAAAIDGGAGTFAATSARTLGINGGTLRNLNDATDLVVDGVDATAGGLLNVVIGAGGGTVFADDARSVTLSANAPITGTGLLTKDGNGTLVLNGGATPSVRVADGTLALAATGSVTGALVTVDNGATLDVSAAPGGYSFAAAQTLAGDGAVVGSIAAAGAIAPGNIAPGDSIGSLDVSGTVDLSGTLRIEYDGGTGASDLLAVGGDLDVTGATVDFALLSGGAAADGDTFTFATYAGTLSGTLAATNVPSGYEVRYGTNAIALAPIPEPVALAGLAALGLIAGRRTRRAAAVAR